MSYEIDEVNYKDYINNDTCKKAKSVEIGLLFVPKDIGYFECHNYISQMTIFDFNISEYLRREALTSYETDNPITRSYDVFFEDVNGTLEYCGKKYKSIDNLVIDNVDCIPLYAFSNYKFNDVSITNTRRIDSCAFFSSEVDSICVDNSVEYIGFNALPHNLKIIDGYYDIKDNPKLVLAKLDDIRNPIISKETRIIYQHAASNSKCIEELIIPDGVTMIGSFAFYNCQNIQIISLPKTLKYIDRCAFEKTSAKEVYYDGKLEDWNKIEINDEDWSYREWLDRAISLDSSPWKKDNDFYVLDEKGSKLYNRKRYTLVNKQ